MGAKVDARDGRVRRPPPRLGPLRRFWWVIAAVVAMAVAAAVLATISVPTTYTARSSLIVSSNNRSPDQDAVLVQGYVDYFNDAAYQRQMLEQADVETPVALVARSAAASPIMLVDATAATPEEARASAAAVAAAFQQDINRVGDARRAAQVQALQDQIDEARDEGGSDAETTIAQLQTQVAELEDDNTNRLQELQFEGGGVSVNAPSLARNVVVGGFGGLVLGVLVALGLGFLSGSRRPGRSS